MCNSLSCAIHQSPLLSIFRCHLKTFIYQSAFSAHLSPMLPSSFWTLALYQSSSVVFCCTAGFWHPSSMSPSLCVLSCSFECNFSPSIFVKSCCIWILLLPLGGLSAILPSTVSCCINHLRGYLLTCLLTGLSRLVFCVCGDASWKNTLDTGISFGSWTYEEDRTLWLAVQELGAGWWCLFVLLSNGVNVLKG